MKKQKLECVAVDPGLNGAVVYLGPSGFKFWTMPTNGDGLAFGELQAIFNSFSGVPIFLERAVSFGMGTKSAFNYGRAFGFLEIAIKLSKNPVTYIEPGKWTKVIHAGISSDLKPKVKSLVAVDRLCAKYVDQIPKTPRTKKLHDGVVDALLMAVYGLRELGQEREDFF